MKICAKEARRLKSKIEFRRLIEKMKKRFLGLPGALRSLRIFEEVGDGFGKKNLQGWERRSSGKFTILFGFSAQASTLGVFNFSFGTLQVLGSRPNPRSFGRRRRIFFTMRSEDSETAHLLGSGPVLRHNNACVRDVLTAPSNVYLNLDLNLFHAYF